MIPLQLPSILLYSEAWMVGRSWVIVFNHILSSVLHLPITYFSHWAFIFYLTQIGSLWLKVVVSQSLTLGPCLAFTSHARFVGKLVT